MSIYYLIIYCLFSFFIAGILLLLLKWTITVSAQFEDSVSCRATLSSIGKIVHVDVLYQPQGSSITFHILKCLKFDNRSQTSYKVHDGIKSKSQKKGSGIQPGAALINPLVNLLKCIKIDSLRFDVKGGLGDPYRTGLLSAFIPLVSFVSTRNLELQYYPDFLRSSFSLKSDCQFHFLGANLIAPAIGVYQSIRA